MGNQSQKSEPNILLKILVFIIFGQSCHQPQCLLSMALYPFKFHTKEMQMTAPHLKSKCRQILSTVYSSTHLITTALWAITPPSLHDALGNCKTGHSCRRPLFTSTSRLRPSAFRAWDTMMLLWRICSRLLVLVYILLKWLQILTKRRVERYCKDANNKAEVDAADAAPHWPGRGSRQPGLQPAPVHPQSLGQNLRSSALAGRHLCAHDGINWCAVDIVSSTPRELCVSLLRCILVNFKK